MPKVNQYPFPKPDQVDGADTRLELGWHDNVVTVAVTKLRAGADRHQDFVPGADPAEPYVPVWDGVGLQFTERRQINELIRNLRKARNTAFGHDE